MRTELIERTRACLAQAGYQLSEPALARAVSFDAVARRGEELILLKVFTNADSLSEALADELRTLAGLLRASPLLVGERSSAGPLEDGVLYFRHGVPLVTPGTLEEQVLRDQPPLVYAAPGGYYVRLDGGALRALRDARRMSLGQVAEAAGVSRRAIAMYEEGMGALVEVAERLEALFEEALVQPMEVLRQPQPVEPPAFDPARVQEAWPREVLARLSTMGYRVVVTERSIFNAISQEQARAERMLLTGVGEWHPALAERARALQSVGAVLEREVAIFVRDRKARDQVEGAAVIGLDELQRMADPAEVRELVQRRGQPIPDERQDR